LIELLFPIGLVMLYAFEMNGGLLPEMLRASKPSEAFLAVFDGQVIPDSNTAIGTPWGTMHIQFFAHALLIVLMMVATFIDFDERLIPDWITTPGTLLALIGSAMFPHWHLLFEQIGVNGSFLELLQPASPSMWNSRWSGDAGLWIGLACYSGWCFALADRRLIIRRGFRKAVLYFCAGLVRHWTWKILLGMWLGGLVMIVVAHQALSAPAWQSLFSSLVGMALGGAVVWAVRIVASLAMRVEALGFGDVTLMAMVGAFIGWQPTWLAFFLAPIVAICFVLIIWIITRDPATPFGPYLCAGTLLTLLFWDALFNQWAAGLFALGSTLIMILLGFLLLLGFVLWVWYQIKQQIFR
jgi:prepilin signal peptidase PulO-like enzyme (type II secretory pathway)